MGLCEVAQQWHHHANILFDVIKNDKYALMLVQIGNLLCIFIHSQKNSL